MHNTYARRPALWSDYSVPTARDLGVWDTWQYRALNGDDGGTWDPKTPIIIGGAGVLLSGAGQQLVGGVTTATGGRLQHGSDDYVELGAARTRTEVLGLLGAMPNQGLVGLGGTPNEVNQLSVAPFGISPGLAGTGAGGFIVPIPSRYLHQGANLVEATVTLRALTRQPGFGPSTYALANVVSMNPAASSFDQLVPQFTTQTWIANHSYPLNSIVIPNGASPSQTGYYYKATAVFGTHVSASTPPFWPTAIGNNVVDNPGPDEINWKCYGYAGTLPAANGTRGATYGGGAVQQQVMGGGLGSPLAIDCSSYDYYLSFTFDSYGGGTAAAPNWLIHALSLSYDNILDLRPE